MKIATIGIAALLLVAASPVAAQKVYVDYDTYADLDSYKSFAWVDTNTTSLKLDYPEVDSMIKNNIEYYMVKGGMIEDLEDPDVYVTYHASTSEQTQFMTSTFGYGYGAGWAWGPYWGPMMTSGTMDTDLQKGHHDHRHLGRPKERGALPRDDHQRLCQRPPEGHQEDRRRDRQGRQEIPRNARQGNEDRAGDNTCTEPSASTIIPIAMWLAVPAAAQKSYIDYDRTVDMKSFKTYAWASTPECFRL